MAYEEILVEKAHGVVIVTLHRPDKLKAMTARRSTAQRRGLAWVSFRGSYSL